MTDYFWPQHLVPSSSSWSLIANTAAFTSPLTGATRTLGRGGDRWRCSLTFNNLTTDKRAVLQAFLSQLRGQANRVYVTDHAYRKRGSYATANLLPSLASPSSWSSQYAAGTASDESVRITATAHSAAQIPALYQNFTLSSGAAYALRGMFVRSSTGTASMGPSASDGGSSASSYSTAAGLKTVKLVSNGTTAYAYLAGDSTGSTMATGDYIDVSYASFARCMVVYGGSQTGSVVNLSGLGSVAQGILLPGDRIEIEGRMYMLTERVDSTAASSSRCHITPPLRSSPADNAPVIVHDPACKMLLADNTVSWSNIPGRFSSFSVDLIEDIT